MAEYDLARQFVEWRCMEGGVWVDTYPPSLPVGETIRGRWETDVGGHLSWSHTTFISGDEASINTETRPFRQKCL